ncbi:up-regulated during septation domain-containing protein [Hirsutella rhossiliensis]|uniref:Up-regulated during septation domain-containing protein n=1 Tax=Hirsutella rhossiliensis TaxID=111463 RepID=A0A9P8SMP7_9HYPO|nr:up-regulated during septation domain-containing protein [Hirsutella rhossiliensis]KAH0967085.1 up-regulated during septation domain-containing protein [Hirsutella rhossiliensis]
MNGFQAGRAPFDYGASIPPLSSSSPNSKPMANGYRLEVPNGLEKVPLPFGSTGSGHLPRTGRVDLRDAIQVHLLTETALSDSKSYSILSQEEVDELKKLSQLLAQRVESTKKNLAMQSKYRDAAVSMAKLYGPAQPDDPNAIEAEREREACERQCEQLAAELFNLEKRLMGPQRRLLEHTAGILQLTHKASKKKPPPPIGQLINGMPGSPESLHTYSLSGSSLDQAADDNYLDDPSIYQLDYPGGPQVSRQPKKNAIEIPMKSPIREQHQLRGEMDRMREENMQLRGQTDVVIKQLQHLNSSLRETIIRFNPEINGDYQEPQRVAHLQRPTESDVQGQINYLEASLRVADSKLGQAMSGGLDAETGPVLERLWDSIQSGFAETRKRKEERRKARADKSLPDEDDVSEDEGVSWLHAQASTLRDQKYVLQRQVKQQRELNNKSDTEKDEALGRRQEELEQSRQLLLNAEKDATEAQTMLSKALDDLETARNSAGAAEAATADITERDAKINALEAQLKEAEKNLATAESEGNGAVQKLANVDLQIASLTQEKAAAEEKVQGLEKELGEKAAKLSENEKVFKMKENEMELLNMTLAELKTEVTIARAELDGAYGSRAERAADVAALKNNSEVVKLQNQVTRLKQELGETVQELEGITKETIGAEREKVELEVKLDEAMSAKEAVEAEMQRSREQMSKLQEELDGERLKAASGQGTGGRPGAGASMLSEQFRATMREERKRFQEDLKEERSKCRKLEEELNRLKRSQGPGKGPLSPR